MNKKRLLDALIDRLQIELKRLHLANQDANATASQCAHRAEAQRDTCGLEASYLAQGYAKQCDLIEQQIAALKKRELHDFCGQEIDLGAIVEVELNGENDCYLLLDYAGGMELSIDQQRITVITPESPVGAALMGNVEAGFFSFRQQEEGIILAVY